MQPQPSFSNSFDEIVINVCAVIIPKYKKKKYFYQKIEKMPRKGDSSKRSSCGLEYCP